MIRILLSSLLGKKRISQAELARMTKIRPSTINDYYHELTDRMNLNHLDLICEALDCDIGDIIVYEKNNEPSIVHYKNGEEKHRINKVKVSPRPATPSLY